jgi:putative ABC transport system permease protein
MHASTSSSTISLGLLWAIMTLGVYITFRILNVADMSAEGLHHAGRRRWPHVMIIRGLQPVADAAGRRLCAGMAGGLCITGILHTKLDIPALLSGIS